ncbi:hypothetical protein C0995_015617 [Termitomyces sp. Mi166|nr:hypothetical protein C0995_013993 [Termitomyces sp. Mi166\
MLFSPAARPASLAPKIGDDILPTPAEEWAEKTVTSIRHSVDFNSLVLPPSATSTPRIPGAYPFESEVDYSKGIAFHQGYVRTQKNVMDAVMGAGAAARYYLPGTWGSYLSSSIERKPIITKVDSQPEHGNIQDADPMHRHPSEITRYSDSFNSSEALPDRLSAHAQFSLDPSLYNEKAIDTSYLTPHTNPDAEHRSSVLSDTSIRTINGSLTSSPSRYSSQLSLTMPMNGVLLSSSETADTTHHGSETEEPKHDHTGESANAHVDKVAADYSDSGNDRAVGLRQLNSEDDTTRQHGALLDIPVGSSYPSFLGPIASGSNRHAAKVSRPNDVVIGPSSLSPKSEEVHKVVDTKADVEESQPDVNTQASTHPLAGSDAKLGILLKEQYQKALDDKSDRQLNLSPGKGHILATKPASEKETTQEVRQAVQGSNNHVSSNDGTETPRLRTMSVVFDKPAENRQKSQRPVSEGYTPKGIASNGAQTNSMSPANGSNKASRASFLNKLRGEMKVISGKLSNNEAKVEEGRRLMGKIN